MSKATSIRCLSIVGLFLAATCPAAAMPTPQEILNRALDAILGARTYQASIQMRMNRGPIGAMTTQFNLKTAAWKKMWAKVETTTPGNQTQQNPMSALYNNSEIVDDGTSSWTYMPAMKQYLRGPTGIGSRLVRSMLEPSANMALKLIGTQNIGGRPTYVVQAVPRQALPNVKEARSLFYIDQATFHLQQVASNGTLAARGDRAEQPISTTIVLRNQRFNEPIPNSLFKFTPPPGSHEAQSGMMSPFGAVPPSHPPTRGGAPASTTRP